MRHTFLQNILILDLSHNDLLQRLATHGLMLLHVIFPSKYFSTVSAGKAGRAVETSNVAQQIVPPRKAGTTMGSGAGEGANACVGFEVNLKVGSFGESFATVRDVAEVALVTTSFDAGNTMGAGATGTSSSGSRRRRSVPGIGTILPGTAV